MGWAVGVILILIGLGTIGGSTGAGLFFLAVGGIIIAVKINSASSSRTSSPMYYVPKLEHEAKAKVKDAKFDLTHDLKKQSKKAKKAVIDEGERAVLDAHHFITDDPKWV